jgi:Uma2 family endonuclease
MSETARRKMSISEFYDWLAAQTEGRFELVDGEPLMMAGASRRNDRIAVNAICLIGNHLDGHRCKPFTSDTYIAIPAGNRRQADMGIECGTPDDSSLEADAPALVMEILSPTTRVFDRYEKLEEYGQLPHSSASCWWIRTARRYASIGVSRTGPGRANGWLDWTPSSPCRRSTSDCC